MQELIAQKVTGIWVPQHDSSGHWYLHTPTGKLLSSVTSRLGILSKPHLAKWQIKVAINWLCVEDRWKRLQNEHWKEEMMTGAMLAPFDVRDDAGAVGTVAHNAIERYINEWIATGEKPLDIRTLAPVGCDPRSVASMRAVEAYFKKHEIEPIASELLVGDIKYSAGTLDFLAIVDGKLTLIDFKTSNGIDPVSYSAQVAAYKYFFEQMTGVKIEKTKILHLSKDYDKFTVLDVKNLPKAWKAFKQICGIYDWVYAKGEKVISDIKRLKI